MTWGQFQNVRFWTIFRLRQGFGAINPPSLSASAFAKSYGATGPTPPRLRRDKMAGQAALGSNYNPQNTKCIPACPVKCKAYFSRVVIIIAFLDLGQTKTF